jgi:hypothetical protein
MPRRAKRRDLEPSSQSVQQFGQLFQAAFPEIEQFAQIADALASLGKAGARDLARDIERLAAVTPVLLPVDPGRLRTRDAKAATLIAVLLAENAALRRHTLTALEAVLHQARDRERRRQQHAATGSASARRRKRASIQETIDALKTENPGLTTGNALRRYLRDHDPDWGSATVEERDHKVHALERRLRRGSKKSGHKPG